MMSMLRRKQKPLERLDPGFRGVGVSGIQTLSMALQAEMEVRGGIALFSSAEEPFARFLVVARDAVPALIEQSEVILPGRIATVCCAREAGCSSLVTHAAMSRSHVNDAEIVLRLGAFAFGGGEEFCWSGDSVGKHLSEPGRRW